MKAQLQEAATGQSDHYVVMNKAAAIGAAVVRHDVQLEIPRFSLYDAAGGRPAQTILGPQISAWSTIPELLTTAYEELVNKHRALATASTESFVLEGWKAPEEIHRAIVSASLRRLWSARRGFGERGRKPPMEVLYVHRTCLPHK